MGLILDSLLSSGLKFFYRQYINMDSESSYLLLIGFIIFLFFKKLLAVVVEARVPNYKDLKNAPPLWKKLVNFRRVLNIISIIALSYFYFSIN